jgi:hypothetical protein
VMGLCGGRSVLRFQLHNLLVVALNENCVAAHRSGRYGSTHHQPSLERHSRVPKHGQYFANMSCQSVPELSFCPKDTEQVTRLCKSTER